MRTTMIAIAALFAACDGANPGTDGNSNPDMTQQGQPDGGCKADTTACGGGCINMQTDPNNCGYCGHRCDASQSCVSGMCQSGPAPDMTPAGCGIGMEDTLDDLPQGMSAQPFACMAMATDTTCWSIGGHSTRVLNESQNSCTVLGYPNGVTNTPGALFRCGTAHDCFQDCGDPKKTCFVTHYVTSCDWLQVQRFNPGHAWSPTATPDAIITTGSCL